MYFRTILSVLASMEDIIMSKKLYQPNLNIKYLVVALASAMNVSVYADTTESVDLSAVSNTNSQPSLSQSKPLSPPEGARMGEWLAQELKQAPSHYYEPALVWEADVEISAQQSAYEVLNQKLERFIVGNNADVLPLKQWLDSLSITGRVILPKQDANYLQVNPNVDPVFRKNDTVVLHQKPTTVTVLFDDAKACRVEYQTGVRVKDYIKECQNKFNKNFVADELYLISPDGSVERLTLAKWNAQQQKTPSAGSWLWVPSATNKWSSDLAEAVAEFIGTQGIDLPLPLQQNEKPLTLSQAYAEKARDLPVSPSDWGITGLLQTPTARMQKSGSLAAHVAHVDPYTQYNIVLQPFDRVEAAVRYTNIDGVSYGPVSPDQDLKDKSLDVKLKLLNESRWLPQLAVGWRDPAGTSLFGGEYLVANKRYGDFDFSLGMGWGYLGARGNLENPLGFIDDRFENRVTDKNGLGGELSPKSWFTGRTSLFGGVQWHSPYDPLTVKVEYDGNDYKSERAFDENDNPKDFPVNIGVTWQDIDRGVALSAGLERGDTMMLGLTLQSDLSKLGKVKPKFQQVRGVQTIPRTSYSGLKYQVNLGGNKDNHLSENESLLNAFSQATGWRATDLSLVDGHAYLNVEEYSGVFIKERLKKGMEILRQTLPTDTRSIKIQISRHSEAVGVFNIDPKIWNEQYLQLQPPTQRIEQPVTVTSASKSYQPTAQEMVAQIERPRGSITFSPSLSQSIGGPDGYLYGVFANANADYRLWKGSWLSGNAQVRLADNYDKFSYTANSNLPRVRTNIGEYTTTSRLLLPNLQLNQFKSFGDNWYGLAYAGYLESMFAGVGAEVLYRQPNKTWAVGADVNRVRQRDFDQHFGLRDYEANTGHVSVYWDTPIYDVDMKLSAGQYLAGDKGVTLDLSRTFNNGVKMGGWLTETDVSAEEFGEGSKDKGIYVSIPFDNLFNQWSSGTAKLVYQPLIRDGGAKLNRSYDLYNLTSPMGKSTLEIKNPLEY